MHTQSLCWDGLFISRHSGHSTKRGLTMTRVNVRGEFCRSAPLEETCMLSRARVVMVGEGNGEVDGIHQS